MAVGKMTSVYKQLMGIPAALRGLQSLGVGNAVPSPWECWQMKCWHDVHSHIQTLSLSLLSSLLMQKGLVGLCCNWSKYLLNACSIWNCDVAQLKCD